MPLRQGAAATVQTSHVGAEVHRRQQPQARQLVADVIGVALVEIGLRNARGYLLSRPIHDIAESGHAEDYDTSRANETNA